MGRIQSWPSIRRPASSAWRCSRTGSPSARCARGRAPGVGAVATQSVVEPAYGPNALDRLADGIGAPAGARRAARGRPAGRRAPGRGDRHRGGQSASTPARTASPTPATSTGEHHSCQANMMARDTVPAAMSAAFDAADGRAAGPAAGRARRGRGRGRRRARAPVGRDGRRAGRGRAVAADGRPARRGPRRAAGRAAPAAHAPARLRPGGRGRRAAGRGAHRRGGRALPARPRSSRPDSDELLFWSGLARAQAGDLDARRGGGPAGGRGATRTGWCCSTASHRSSLRRAKRSVALSRSPAGGTSRGRRGVPACRRLTAVGVDRSPAADARRAGARRADGRGRVGALADVLA